MAFDAVRLGALLFTLVEPHPGHAVEFNRFYERDHFYAGMMVAPYTFSGQRWVAPRALKELRYPDGPSDFAAGPRSGSYLALYWCLADHEDEWQRWTVDAWHELTAVGRMDFGRDRVHSVVYRFAGAVARDVDGPAPEQALDHRYPGLGVVVHRGAHPDALESWLREQHLPAAVAGSPVGQVLVARPRPHLADAPADVTGVDTFADCVLTLWFLDRPAAEVWSEVFAGQPAAVRASGLGEVLWMSPFLPTVPGTDRYADEL